MKRSPSHPQTNQSKKRGKSGNLPAAPATPSLANYSSSESENNSNNNNIRRMSIASNNNNTPKEANFAPVPLTRQTPRETSNFLDLLRENASLEKKNTTGGKRRKSVKRNTKKSVKRRSRRTLSSQWAADNHNPGIINGITTNPPQQPSQINEPTTNVQVEDPPTHAPPTGDGVTTPNTIPPPPPPPPPGRGRGAAAGGGKLGNPNPNPKKTGRGIKKKPEKKNNLVPRRKQTGKKKLTTDEEREIERERGYNALIRIHQQNADQHGYSMGAIGNPFNVSARPQQEPVRVLPLAEPNQHNMMNFALNNFALNNYPPPQQNKNTIEPLFSGLNNINNTNGGKRRNSVKRRKSVKRKTRSKRQRGGSKEEEKELMTADLMTASVHGDTDTVEELLGKGADVNGKDKRFGRTALMSAMYRGHTHIVELLLDNGANVHAKDDDGTTALCLAIFYKHTDIEGLLNEVIKSGEEVRCHIKEVIEQRKKEQNTQTDNIPPLSVFAAASLPDKDRQKLHRASLDIDEKTGKLRIGGKRKTRKSKRNSRSKRQRGGRKRTVKKNKSKGKKTRNN